MREERKRRRRRRRRGEGGRKNRKGRRGATKNDTDERRTHIAKEKKRTETARRKKKLTDFLSQEFLDIFCQNFRVKSFVSREEEEAFVAVCHLRESGVTSVVVSSQLRREKETRGSRVGRERKRNREDEPRSFHRFDHHLRLENKKEHAEQKEV
jgi:hypothetical protein